jgi:hypothetical protein
VREHMARQKLVEQGLHAYTCEGADEKSWHSRPRHAVLNSREAKPPEAMSREARRRSARQREAEQRKARQRKARQREAEQCEAEQLEPMELEDIVNGFFA